VVTHKLKVVYEFEVTDEAKAVAEAQAYQMENQFVYSSEDPDYVTEIGQVLEMVFDLDQGGEAQVISSVKIVNRIFSSETVV
jgi:hypothetical protein